ncbi:hypothetical protein GH714_036245 [Hevea brasiliensis]|uniref:Uncharacterized protein n=1 Tax=Hevea brasiliensis TaxID=3981 RepID=A0A6A6L051_HEVBR|nr:hypothetical protein GH714_036245 [Hevea brasiliensis]
MTSPKLASLQDLANRGSWHSILDKVRRARSHYLLNTPYDHLIYLACNVLGLAKLRRFKDAITELDSVDDFDCHHYRYETYSKIYPNRSGFVVPFSLRWLHALIPIKSGNHQEGLDRFYMLLDFVRGKLKEKQDHDILIKMWRKREVFVMNLIISEHLGNKEFGVCLDLIKDLFSRGNLDPVLLSKLGYIQMQIGDLEGAKRSFDKVEKLLNERNVREYEECIERDPMDVVAINNKALCLMYLRALSDSIKVLENSLE